jgi:acetyl esterase/lipase
MLTKPSIAALCVVCAFSASALGASVKVWQPAPGHTQIPVWPGPPPGGSRTGGEETVTTTGSDELVGGKPWDYVSNVSQPTLTVYSPRARNTGAAVVVFPGGGYSILAIDLEGSEICDWLNSIGVTAVLLKYRVPNAGPTWDQKCGCDRTTQSSMPLQDAQRTISLVRAHAAQWHIDPHKIGVIGFSAAGHMIATTITHFDHRAYTPVDAADQESCRPDFAVAVYPGHLFNYHKNELWSDIHVTKNTPPTFIVHAGNDNVDGVSNSLVYYEALKNAGVPTELHLYAEGKHAFGLRRTKDPITAWPELAEKWLRTIGIIAR